MNRGECRAVWVAKNVRAFGVPCRKVPHRSAVRTLWTNPSTLSLRHFQCWRPIDIAKLIAATTYAAAHEEHDDTARTERLRGMDGWREMVESGRWPVHLTHR